jgi:hypothetical protein
VCAEIETPHNAEVVIDPRNRYCGGLALETRGKRYQVIAQ